MKFCVNNKHRYPSEITITFQGDCVRCPRYVLFKTVWSYPCSRGTSDNAGHILLLEKPHVPFIPSFSFWITPWSYNTKQKKQLCFYIWKSIEIRKSLISSVPQGFEWNLKSFVIRILPQNVKFCFWKYRFRP